MFFKNLFRKPRLRSAASMRATLLSYGLCDEIVSGLPVVGLPLLRDHLGLSYAQIGLLFAAGGCSALVLEPIINVLSDNHSKRWWILAGLLCLTLIYILAGFTSRYDILLLVFALYYPAVGTAVGLAEATLIDANPAESTATMTRWTLLSSVGDILAPLLVTTLVSFHQGWPELCRLAASLWAGLLLFTAVQPFPRHATEESNSQGQPLSGALIASFPERFGCDWRGDQADCRRKPREYLACSASGHTQSPLAALGTTGINSKHGR